MPTSFSQMPHSLRARQTGAVLFVALIFVLVLSILAVSSMQGTVLEERMAGNTQDHNRALQAAETALRDAETFIQGLANTNGFNGNTPGLYAANAVLPNASADMTWAAANTATRAVVSNLPLVKSQPRYYIQMLFTTPGGAANPNLGVKDYSSMESGANVTTFLITARGTGINDNNKVVLREHFGRVF